MTGLNIFKANLRRTALTGAITLGAVAFAAPAAMAGGCGSTGGTYCNGWTQAGGASYSASSYSTASSYSSASMAAPAGLCKVQCPVSIDLKPGERVLDCYQKCQPAPVTTAYQVVRPVIVRRYPVPVYVPPVTVRIPAACAPVRYIRGADSRYGYEYNVRRGCR